MASPNNYRAGTTKTYNRGAMKAEDIRAEFVKVGWVGRLRERKPWVKRTLLFERCSNNTGAA